MYKTFYDEAKLILFLLHKDRGDSHQNRYVLLELQRKSHGRWEQY